MKLNNLLLSTAFLAVFAASVSAFELKSADIAENGMIAEKFVFKGFGCNGGNLSPALSWRDPPAGTKSFALMVHDPDATTGGAGFWHWIVYDIPASAAGLPEGVGKDGKGLPQGAAQLATDFGEPGYGGPCPPEGAAPHHYQFTLYALKIDKLELPPHATASLAGFLISSNALGKARFGAAYGR